MIEEPIKIMMWIVLAVVVVILLVFYHGMFIQECVASGNTEKYCEMMFWRTF